MDQSCGMMDISNWNNLFIIIKGCIYIELIVFTCMNNCASVGKFGLNASAE